MVKLVVLLSLIFHGLFLFLSLRVPRGTPPADVGLIRVTFFLLAFVLFLATRTFIHFTGMIKARVPSFLKYLAPVFSLPSLFYPFLGYLMVSRARDGREYFLFLAIGLFFILRFYSPLRKLERGGT